MSMPNTSFRADPANGLSGAIVEDCEPKRDGEHRSACSHEGLMQNHVSCVHAGLEERTTGVLR